MLINSPGLVRVRLELARAFFLKGEDDLARQHFEHVPAGDPPSAVVDNINGFLNEVRRRRHWSFDLGWAMAPDSNIGGSSGQRIIYIYDLPFRRNEEEPRTSGVGVAVWRGAEYQVPLGSTLRLPAGADTSRWEYAQSEFDQLVLSTHAGPRWLVDNATEISVFWPAPVNAGWARLPTTVIWVFGSRQRGASPPRLPLWPRRRGTNAATAPIWPGPSSTLSCAASGSPRRRCARSFTAATGAGGWAA